MLDGLTLLDAVLASPDVIWLATEEEKRIHVAALTGIPAEKLPQAVTRDGPSRRVRLFPDNVPIGMDLSGRWLFVYLATDDRLDMFRLFLQRHFDLFRQLPAWTLRIVLPPHLEGLGDMCLKVVREDFAKPIDERMVKMLRWYFKQRQAHEQGAEVDNEEEYDQAHFAFRAGRYQVLYRRWVRMGEAALEGRSSTDIADAIAQGSALVETLVLPHQYRHLMPLFDAPAREPKGAEEGDEGPTRSRPPHRPSDALVNARNSDEREQL